jgi:hypothetical protein
MSSKVRDLFHHRRDGGVDDRHKVGRFTAQAALLVPQVVFAVRGERVQPRPLLRLCYRHAYRETFVVTLAEQRVGDLDGLVPDLGVEVAHGGGKVLVVPGRHVRPTSLLVRDIHPRCIWW